MVLHMGEQLLSGLQELYRLKHAITLYDSWFQSPDVATVVLVTIGGFLIYLAFFSILRGGRARFIALEVLGVFSVLEVHHPIESLIAHAYTPGLVTSIPYVAFGVLFMRALLPRRPDG